MNLFRRPKPDVSGAARTMAKAGAKHDRAKIRSTVDDMRKQLGMPPAQWPDRP